ncbi:M48 family metalloprotease [Candidatus Micrarchaeota archaeon]|nr:M48 family metalloprotease [Candidatus Micrarchaeota archaeon]
MWGMADHVIDAGTLFFQDGTNVTLVAASLAFAVLLILSSRYLGFSARTRSILMHAHVALLLFPLVFFATTLTCKQAGLCEVGLTQTLLYVIPITLALGLAFGLLVVPMLHRWRAQPEAGRWQRFIHRHAGELGMRKAPDVFIVDSGRPEAYSTGGLRPAIFITVGMSETLSERQMQAVLLHELAHIREGSYVLKPITRLLQSVYPEPIVAPAAMTQEEERKADAYATWVQKTNVHLNRAKRKLAE